MAELASKLAVDGMDLLVNDMKWVDPNTILFESGYHGTLQLFKVDLNARQVQSLLKGERAIRSVSATSAITRP